MISTTKSVGKIHLFVNNSKNVGQTVCFNTRYLLPLSLEISYLVVLNDCVVLTTHFLDELIVAEWCTTVP